MLIKNVAMEKGRCDSTFQRADQLANLSISFSLKRSGSHVEWSPIVWQGHWVFKVSLCLVAHHNLTMQGGRACRGVSEMPL